MKAIFIALLAFSLCLPVVGADKKPLTKEESAKVIEAAIRKELKKPTGELTKADLEKVTKLYLHDNQLTSVKGLEKLTQLEFLNLNDNKLTSVKGLEKLTKLEHLRINGNKLTKLPEGMEKLTQLKVLHIDGNKLTNVKGLEKLTKLKYLWLYRNKLTDVSGLEKLTQLRMLGLKHNPDLTKAQIDQLQKAFPNFFIPSDFD